MYNVTGIELVHDGAASKDDDYSAGDGVKYSLPQTSSNVEGPVVSDTNQSVDDLRNDMKNLW